MGNQLSNFLDSETNDTTKIKPASVKQIIDYIATYYILTMDFQSLKKLYDIEYCDKLVILTSDIIERYFTDLQITYLAENIKKRKSEDVSGTENANADVYEKDKMIFFNKDDIAKLDIRNPAKKRRVCIGIAKFYIKIAHVFATILTTINPIYVYKDKNGDAVKADIYNRSKIPKDADVKILKLNICDTRIDALKRDSNVDFSNELSDDTEIKLHPDMCSFNLKPRTSEDDIDSDDTSDSSDSKTRDLEDEPGIPELMELYYDDNYDYETGKFRGMKEKTREAFNENLRNFYSVFMDTTGEPMPENIKKFSDIKLKDYKNKPKCKGRNAPYNSTVRGTVADDLFKQYAENLRKMMKQATANQEFLLDVLNKLFVYTTDPQTKKKIIRINPELTEERLHDVVVETRAIIINLYLTCEIDYANGIKLYEAIIDKKILETARSQMETMERELEQLVTEDDIPKPAELDELKEIANNKIQREQEAIAKREEMLQKEKEMALLIRPVERPIVEQKPVVKPVVEQAVVKPIERPTVDVKPVEPPIVNVKINVQGPVEQQMQGEQLEQVAGKNKTTKKHKVSKVNHTKRYR
jgi:hypothetical protein